MTRLYFMLTRWGGILHIHNTFRVYISCKNFRILNYGAEHEEREKIFEIFLYKSEKLSSLTGAVFIIRSTFDIKFHL